MKSELLWRLEEVGRVVAHRPIYSHIVGELTAGVLLSQIVFWFKPQGNGGSKLNVFLDGRYWLVKRRTDWYDEVGITPKQFDRACDLLVSLGILQRENYMHGASPVTHLSLNVKVLSKLLASHPKVKDMVVPQKGNSEVPQKGKTISKGVKKGEKPMATAAEQLAALEAKKKLIPETLPPARVKPSVLGIYWTKMMSRHYEHFCPPLTRKQEGMLGHWIKKAGKVHAYPAMLWAIRNWSDFVYEVDHSQGVTLGHQPGIMALLKHADIAVSCYLKAGQEGGVQLTAKQPTKVKFIVE